MTDEEAARLRAELELKTHEMQISRRLAQTAREIEIARAGIAVGAQLAAPQETSGDRMAATPTHGGRAVKRMVNLMDGFNRELEKHVEDTLAKAIAPKLENVKNAVTNLGQKVGKAFDEAAQHADDYVGQLTNGEDDPTESETPSGGSAG